MDPFSCVDDRCIVIPNTANFVMVFNSVYVDMFAIALAWAPSGSEIFVKCGRAIKLRWSGVCSITIKW